MALGFHHVCTIDTNASLQCDGHNSAGQADAGRQRSAIHSMLDSMAIR